MKTKITESELQEKLKNHKLWLDSDFKEGKQIDLEGFDLREAILKEAILQNADLEDTDLEDTDLKNANLQSDKPCKHSNKHNQIKDIMNLMKQAIQIYRKKEKIKTLQNDPEELIKELEILVNILELEE